MYCRDAVIQKESTYNDDIKHGYKCASATVSVLIFFFFFFDSVDRVIFSCFSFLCKSVINFTTTKQFYGTFVANELKKMRGLVHYFNLRPEYWQNGKYGRASIKKTTLHNTENFL